MNQWEKVRRAGQLAGAAGLLVWALQGCGGGGGFASGEERAAAGAKPPATTPNILPPGTLAPSEQLAQQCAVPRTGIDPATNAPYPDTQGSAATEKAWLRSWIDETYLWYSEVPNYNPVVYPAPIDYFLALKTPLGTASGVSKDRFHFTIPTAEWEAESQSGLGVGYGVSWSILAGTQPRSIVAAQVTEAYPAARAGIARGAVLLAVDGIDVVNSNDIDGINRALYPGAIGESHSFTVRDRGSSVPRTVQLVAGTVLNVPVPQAKVLDTASGPVGYLLFNDHIATAEGQLVAGIEKLKAAQVKDLVLDLRYNGGGYLAIASQLAYMIAGPAATAGKTFERLMFNDKNPFGLDPSGQRTPFASETLGFSSMPGQALPSLGLNRVFVLTSSETCSASEAIVNGLRGIGIAVHLVGGTTCGKPYGFYPTDNCGTTYFSIQFQGVNEAGFGDYGDGFPASCAARDDFSRDLGDPAEGQLAAALALRSSGSCPALAAASGRDRALSASGAGSELVPRRFPMRNERILLPPGRTR